MSKSSSPESIAFQATPHLVAGIYIFLPSLLLCWLIAPLFVGLYEYFRLKNTKYTISNERIICESGIFTKKIEEVELYRIRDFQVTRSFVQRLFGVGSINIISTDKTTPEIELQCVPETLEIKEYIRTCTEQQRNTKRRTF